MATFRDLMTRLGLTVNERKTRLVQIPEERFDFLGYTIGQFYGHQGKPYIGTQPSKKAVRRLLRRIHEETSRQWNWQTVEKRVSELNPICAAGVRARGHDEGTIGVRPCFGFCLRYLASLVGFEERTPSDARRRSRARPRWWVGHGVVVRQDLPVAHEVGVEIRHDKVVRLLLVALRDAFHHAVPVLVWKVIPGSSSRVFFQPFPATQNTWPPVASIVSPSLWMVSDCTSSRIVLPTTGFRSRRPVSTSQANTRSPLLHSIGIGPDSVHTLVSPARHETFCSTTGRQVAMRSVCSVYSKSAPV